MHRNKRKGFTSMHSPTKKKRRKKPQVLDLDSQVISEEGLLSVIDLMESEVEERSHLPVSVSGRDRIDREYQG